MKRLRAICMLLLLTMYCAGPWMAAAQTPETAAPAAPAAPAVAEPVPDPSGANTGGIADVTAATPGKPTLEEVAAVAGHAKVSINFVWTLVTGFLVMFMQAGFAMVEAGFTRYKNAAHTMAMNFMVYPLGMLGFYVCGFAFMFGGIGTLGTLGGYAGLNAEWTINIGGIDWGILGHKGFFLSGGAYDAAVYVLFLFQMVFMDTTATIPTGSMAERWKYSSFFLYACFLGTVMYPLFGNWVWGGGWLSQLGKVGLGHGYIDFAGSSVVHMQGGVIALIGAWMIGPRIGKYGKDGSVHAIPGHNIPMAIIGTFILAFGWFGFNPGSTLAGSDLRIGVVAVNTMLAGTTGAIAATLWMWWLRSNKPDPSMMCNGLLAGLVAITAPCAFVNSVSASIIGLISGVLVVEAAIFIDTKLKVDDPVGAVAVHGCNGAWGCIALGLFADGTYGDGWGGVAGTVKGLFYGDAKQFIVQIIGVVTCAVTLTILSLIVFSIVKAITGLRVDPKDEVEGLDIPEMGVLGYSHE